MASSNRDNTPTPSEPRASRPSWMTLSGGETVTLVDLVVALTTAVEKAVGGQGPPGEPTAPHAWLRLRV